MDRNKNGTLSKVEIMENYEKYFGKKLKYDDVEKLFDAVDLNKDGDIEFSEFVIACMNEK